MVSGNKPAVIQILYIASLLRLHPLAFSSVYLKVILSCGTMQDYIIRIALGVFLYGISL